MSIQVDNIIKEYGTQKALNGISFKIDSGEIVGFLGPNGAGKSTMMKIITTYIEPTSGSVLVNGFDTKDNGIDVKQSVGYLPEHNPLYLDFYVREYLKFHADIHKVGKERIEKVINFPCSSTINLMYSGFIKLMNFFFKYAICLSLTGTNEERSA